MNEGYNIGQTPIPEKIPQIKIPTLNSMEVVEPIPKKVPYVMFPTRDPKTGKHHKIVLSPIPDSTVKTQDKMSEQERKDSTDAGYETIIMRNERLELLAVRAINREMGAFSELMNKLTVLCLTISDEKIDEIIEKFRISLTKKAGKYNIKEDSIKDLLTGMKMIGGSVGIKSVIHCMQDRLVLHSKNSKTIPAFFFEDYLDSLHSIDLIEMIVEEYGIVINLIQVKSRDYTGDELEKYKNDHKNWVDNHLIDLDTYKKSIEVEPKNSAELNKLVPKVSEIGDLLLGMINEDTMTTDELFENIGIKGMSNVERVWILSVAIDRIREAFVNVKDLGLTEYELSRTNAVISDIEARLAVVIEQKKNTHGISEIHLICYVKKNEASDVVNKEVKSEVSEVSKVVNKKVKNEASNVMIFEAKGTDRKAVYIKY